MRHIAQKAGYHRHDATLPLFFTNGSDVHCSCPVPPNRGSANGAPAGGAFLADIPTEAVAEVRGPDELRLLIFSAAPWRGLEKSERGPSLASLFPPQADGLRHPASAAPCLRIAGRGPNNSSLLPPLAVLVVVAVGSAAVRVLYRPALT